MKTLNLNHERLEQRVTAQTLANLPAQIKLIMQTNPEQYRKQLQSLTRTLVQTLKLCGVKDLKESHVNVGMLSALMRLSHRERAQNAVVAYLIDWVVLGRKKD